MFGIRVARVLSSLAKRSNSSFTSSCSCGVIASLLACTAAAYVGCRAGFVQVVADYLRFSSGCFWVKVSKASFPKQAVEPRWHLPGWGAGTGGNRKKNFNRGPPEFRRDNRGPAIFMQRRCPLRIGWLETDRDDLLYVSTHRSSHGTLMGQVLQKLSL